MKLSDCYNVDDFRKLAKQKLPSPIFHYIDGGADDEITLKRNTSSFDDCDLIPNILASVGKFDSTTVWVKNKFSLFFISNCNASNVSSGRINLAKAAEKFGTFFSLSTLI